LYNEFGEEEEVRSLGVSVETLKEHTLQVFVLTQFITFVHIQHVVNGNIT